MQWCNTDTTSEYKIAYVFLLLTVSINIRITHFLGYCMRMRIQCIPCMHAAGCLCGTPYVYTMVGRLQVRQYTAIVVPTSRSSTFSLAPVEAFHRSATMKSGISLPTYSPKSENDLKWTKHINSICNKMRWLIGMFYRKFYMYSSRETSLKLTNLYFALIWNMRQLCGITPAITCKDLKTWLPVSSHSANIVQRNGF